MSVSVVIPSLNGLHHLKKYLSSVLIAKHNANYQIEIIVVDDNSTDGTYEYLSGIEEQDFKVVKNSKQGISSARNMGVKEAKYNYIFFTDNDVKLEKDFFNKAELFISNSIPAIACAGYLEANYSQIDGVKILYWKNGFMRFTKNILNSHLKSLVDFTNDAYYLSYGVQGAYFFIRRDIFNEIKGFEELYDPCVMEESDLAYKLLKRGYNIAYLYDCNPLHLCGGTINSKVSERTRYQSVRNRIIFTLINIHSLRLMIKFILNLIPRLFFGIERKALLEVYRMRYIIKERRNIEKKASKLSDIDILNRVKRYIKIVKK